MIMRQKDSGFYLSSDKRSQMWLDNTDDTVSTLVYSLAQYVILLMVHLDDCCKGWFYRL